ncbi:hypothetical protein GUITHDRAFT_107618 [Guillardia theta CCMP2712]|uniref:Transmembrane protein n=1 Tax=Guillardia theta (strain CCMP2712) TaxID=905079 RepID=L1JE51_GUITC|nr:hypothetical protein GUITHDRAFT_107618 [Guillardia theta CCMP2712]EKX46414.1 hypothetical protein GUITHDRAFT_107618 [Guillardia theta CCMP2712]|eukprot:XP_005833394.1 hypothetical protein GUITHDRAFT_107618 [Guillardia theta CCMP2712]
MAKACRTRLDVVVSVLVVVNVIHGVSASSTMAFGSVGTPSRNKAKSAESQLSSYDRMILAHGPPKTSSSSSGYNPQPGTPTYPANSYPTNSYPTNTYPTNTYPTNTYPAYGRQSPVMYQNPPSAYPQTQGASSYTPTLSPQWAQPPASAFATNANPMGSQARFHAHQVTRDKLVPRVQSSVSFEGSKSSKEMSGEARKLAKMSAQLLREYSRASIYRNALAKEQSRIHKARQAATIGGLYNNRSLSGKPVLSHGMTVIFVICTVGAICGALWYMKRDNDKLTHQNLETLQSA